MIEFKNVAKTYPSGITPFSGVDLTINDGEVVSIIGPSGTGKSTLLRCINLLDAPTEGEVFIDGECITAPDCDVAQVRKKVGMVFQSFNLFGHLTVLENIMQPPMRKLGKSRQEAYDKAVELLKQMGLLDWQFYYPDQLSGGQKQRVAIARALAMEPKIMLFDEPTSALDPTMVGEVQMIIRDLTRSGMTMLVVSHDMDFCRDISTRVLYLDEGGVYEDGTPEQIFDHPLREKTRAFTHQLKTLTLFIDTPHYDFAAAVMRIGEYCKEHRLSLAVSNRVQRCYEEACHAILLPALKNDAHIRAELSCSDADDPVTLNILYNGPAFVPEQSNNALSLSLLRASTVSLIHRDLPGEDGYTNELIAVVRGDK